MEIDEHAQEVIIKSFQFHYFVAEKVRSTRFNLS